MDPQLTGQADLSNDTVINVAALLREQTGATRLYRFTVDHLRLDDDLDAVEREVHFRSPIGSEG